MRTTVTIDDTVLARAKTAARQADTTLGRYIETALQEKLSATPPPSRRPTVPVFTRGSGPAAGVDVTSNRGLYEALGGE